MDNITRPDCSNLSVARLHKELAIRQQLEDHDGTQCVTIFNLDVQCKKLLIGDPVGVPSAHLTMEDTENDLREVKKECRTLIMEVMECDNPKNDGDFWEEKRTGLTHFTPEAVHTSN